MAGSPGFLSAVSPTTLEVRNAPIAGDPLGSNIAVGQALGFLGIELHTRRRNRVNGRVQQVAPDGALVLEVD